MVRVFFAVAIMAVILSGCSLLVPGERHENILQTGPGRWYDGISVQTALEISSKCLVEEKITPDLVSVREVGAKSTAQYVVSSDRTRDLQIKFTPGWKALYQKPSTYVEFATPVMPGMLPVRYAYQDYHECFAEGVYKYKLKEAAKEAGTQQK